MWSQGTFWCQLSTQVTVSSNKGSQFSSETLHTFPNYSGRMWVLQTLVDFLRNACTASFEIRSYLLELCYCPQLLHIYDLWLWHAQVWTLHSQAVSVDQCSLCWRKPYFHYTVLDQCLKLITTLKVEKNQMGPSSGSKVPLNRHASSFCLSNVPGLVPEVKGTNGCWTCASAFIKLFLNWLLSCVGWSCGHVGLVYI